MDDSDQNGRLKVLLIEDDKVDQLAFTRFIKLNDIPFEYTIAGSVAEAKEILGSNKFDIILSDHFLGDGTAFDILGLSLDTPIIMITGSGDQEIAVKAMKAGAYDYLIKDNENNHFKVLQTTVENAIKHKNAEISLKDSEKRFRELADLLPQMVFELDLEGNFSYANKYGLDSLGYTQDDIDNTLNALELFVPEEVERVMENIQKILKGEKFDNHEYLLNRKDGSSFSVLIYSSPIVKNGKTLGLRGVALDITDRKRSEQKIIEERNRAEMYLDLLGHDINNLNQGILISSELLLMAQDLPDKYNKYVKNSFKQSLAISELIQNVRKYSELHNSEFNLEEVKISDMIERSTERIIQLYPEKNVQINKSMPKNSVKTKSNELLQEVFDNLLTNAIKYNKNNDILLDILCRPTDDDTFWKLEFKDNGPGIPDDKKQDIFKRLSRGDESVHGSGLGLTIVNEIVKESGGQVWVEDKVKGDSSKGSNFVLLLPKDQQNRSKMGSE